MTTKKPQTKTSNQSAVTTQKVLPVFYNHQYVACAAGFDTTRKAEEIYKSLKKNPIKGLRMFSPYKSRSIIKNIISRIHDAEYIRAVETGKPGHLARSNGFAWDDGIPTMAYAHCAGMAAAVTYVLMNGGVAGSLSSGMHHASFDGGSGYCTFNGCVVAIQRALDMGAKRVLLLDFDAHSGGGSMDIINRLYDKEVVHVDVTVSPFDWWKSNGEHKIYRADEDNYVATIRKALNHARACGPFDCIVYNAGMDPINCGVSIESVRKRERMVRDFIGDTPAVFGLAGGYTWGHEMGEVVDWHRMTLTEWATPR
jgi:acetoin utilization deacetylase AcuC-like enzyme